MRTCARRRQCTASLRTWARPRRQGCPVGVCCRIRKHLRKQVRPTRQAYLVGVSCVFKAPGFVRDVLHTRRQLSWCRCITARGWSVAPGYWQHGTSLKKCLLGSIPVLPKVVAAQDSPPEVLAQQYPRVAPRYWQHRTRLQKCLFQYPSLLRRSAGPCPGLLLN